jgi:hypothetical protein
MATDLPTLENPPRAAAKTTLWRRRILMVLFAAVGVPVGTSIVYTFPPSQYNFYPRCLLHWVTGLHCPGCGATRSVGALLHGDLEQAFAYNALFVAMLPLFLFAGFSVVYELWTGKKAWTLRLPSWTVKILILVLIAYFIARNLDVYPFQLLAPHEI